MFRRLLNRLSWSVVTLFGTATLIFTLTSVVPGDVAHVIAGPKATPEVLRQVRELYHLNEPVPKRLGRFYVQLLHGNLGHSFVTDQPVTEAILTRLSTTAALCATGVVMWMLVAVPVGVMTARFRGSLFDRAVLVAASVTLSLPAFWLARMLQYGFAFKLGAFPVAGFRSFGHLLLPGATLAILSVGSYARLIHTNMLEVLESPYVRAARAKGLSDSVVLFRHSLRNALIPVVTILGTDIATLLAGVIFTESVFALPGIGTLAVQAVFSLDVPIIMGVVMFSATVIVVMNLIVDILYRRIDPRIRGE